MTVFEYGDDMVLVDAGITLKPSGMLHPGGGGEGGPDPDYHTIHRPPVRVHPPRNPE